MWGNTFSCFLFLKSRAGIKSKQQLALRFCQNNKLKTKICDAFLTWGYSSYSSFIKFHKFLFYINKGS